MAQGAVDVLGEQLEDGLVITKHGHLNRQWIEASRFDGIESSHPVPDESSLEAGQRLVAYLEGLPEERPVLFLISGGTSSLVELLPEGVAPGQLGRLNDWLLGSGLSITAINRIRKRISRIKEGGLLQFLGQREMVGLLISDVPGDDPGIIGSGLLVAEEQEAFAPSGDTPGWIQELLAAVPEKTGGAGVDVSLAVVANLRRAREAAAEKAGELGYETKVSHAFISADAENSGRCLALEMLDALPGVYIWGGEPTVILPENPGRGGRNQHLALATATVIEGVKDICFLSCGTDGTDGPGEDAGALVDGGTLGRGRQEGFKADESLAQADSGSLLEASGDLVSTGPTGTNVMDLMIGLKVGVKSAGEV
ncbi:glycerate kinase type-2 family protein [Solemya velesiana gill symbiont]|uniref:glycerate kinase type-2 family protein n=1 Tax=Solemya velesiana gill symbiont TaxID=1918948 RepID=UPI001FE8B949|nr:DUF4147 domain-containing protein [Solemya velesiana gill symbiont]